MTSVDDANIAQRWDEVYGKKLLTMWYPNEDVVRFCARYIRTRVAPNVYVNRQKYERVLDLGCGNGRHVIFFAKQGFDVSGVDISDDALTICKEWLQSEGLVADLRCTSVEALPYLEDEFDVVVTVGVLDHVRKDVALRAMREVSRVLRDGGLLHINLRSTDSYDFGKGKEIEPGTFILTDGPEKGLPQHFWTEAELDDLLSGWSILNWELHVRYLDRARTTKDSRWAISAEKSGHSSVK